MVHFVVNLMIAVAWVFLGENPRFEDFVIGYIIGFVLMVICSPLLKSEQAYMRRTLALARFSFHFILLFLQSNWVLAIAVLRQPINTIEPNFVEYDIEGLSLLEFMLLTHCISLTPGTTSSYVSGDRSRLMIHAFDARDPDSVRKEIYEKLERPILAFTR